ncbi:hypothetical protein C4580_02480 [Candidatus Woesearchaeota archaeon]|nr:MAG: hypothetical protein C4580_02480 [Candidatus Woesearchaeota archaeon]
MERGAAAIVLSIVAIVGALATLHLILNEPTGHIVQGETVYPQVRGEMLPFPCATSSAYFLRTEGKYDLYCCSEDMIGQNNCRRPQYIRLP